MSILEVTLVPRKVVKYGVINGKPRTSLPEYRIYTGMVARCKNPNVHSYDRYGGRGIKVCDRWLEDFKNFYDDMGPRPSQHHSIDRINNDGDPPWRRDTLHALIVHLSDQHPTWLLFDADWIHTRQAVPYLSRLRKVVSVGRVKWIPGSKFTGKDNCAWHLYGLPESVPAALYGRLAA